MTPSQSSPGRLILKQATRVHLFSPGLLSDLCREKSPSKNNGDSLSAGSRDTVCQGTVIPPRAEQLLKELLTSLDLWEEIFCTLTFFARLRHFLPCCCCVECVRRLKIAKPWEPMLQFMGGQDDTSAERCILFLAVTEEVPARVCFGRVRSKMEWDCLVLQ